MLVGRVREIWRYPVKSMAGERLEFCEAGRYGLWGDRGWGIRDDASGEIHNACSTVENEWTDRFVRVGRFLVKGEVLAIRCAMPMHPQAELPRDASVLRTIVRQANQCVGLYASVVEPGRCGVGDLADVSAAPDASEPAPAH